MSGLSPRARELFARARAAGAPTAVERAALYAKIESAIDAPTPAPSSPPSSATIPSGWIGASAVIGLAALGIAWLASPERDPPSTASTMLHAQHAQSAQPEAPSASDRPAIGAGVIAGITPPPPSASSTGAEVTRRGDTASTARAVPRDVRGSRDGAGSRAPRSARRADGPDDADADLAAELRLLRRAQDARRDRRWTDALSSLDVHGSRFPGGALAIEREVTRALVLCESGELERGRALAGRFSSSAWARALAAACDGSQPAVTAAHSEAV
jgi:hypothetical protein